MNLFVLAVILAGAICAFVALLSWMRRPRPGTVAVALLNLAFAVWAFGYAGEVLVPDLSSKLLYARLEYVGSFPVPPLLLIFVLEYIGDRRWLTRRRIAALAIVHFLSIALAWTNDAHHLIWTEYKLASAGDLLLLDVQHGPAFWIGLAYSYSLLLIASLLLLRFARRNPGLYANQIKGLLVGVAAPWVGNVLYLSNLNPVPGLDPTVLAFALTGVATGWSILSFKLFDVMPVARALVMERMTDGVIVLNAEERVVDLNPAASRLLGYSSSQAVGAQLSRLRSDWADTAWQAADGCQVITTDEGRTVELSSFVISAQEGLAIIAHDVTEQRRVDEARQQSEERFRSVFEAAPLGMALVNLDCRFTQVNPALCQMLGFSEQELVGRPFLSITHPDDLAADTNLSRQLLAREIPGYGIEKRLVTREGRVVWSKLTATLVGSRIGAPAYMLQMIENISQQRAAEEKLREMAVRDELTGLFNRREMQRLLADELERFGRYGHPLTLLLLDIDHFKSINDTLGHLVGDQALRWVAQTLRETIRTLDRAARFGGEEFAVILPETTEAEGLQVAERIRQCIAEQQYPCMRADGTTVLVRLTISIGVVSSSSRLCKEHELLSGADQALYTAKGQGRNRSCVYSAVFDPAG